MYIVSLPPYVVMAIFVGLFSVVITEAGSDQSRVSSRVYAYILPRLSPLHITIAKLNLEEMIVILLVSAVILGVGARDLLLSMPPVRPLKVPYGAGWLL